MFADWTDRIAAGEVPPAPPRPQGIERNVVITEWDWADPKAYLHDEVSTDRRNPTLNANGLIYGALELSADYLPVLDPVQNRISQVKLTVRDPNTPVAQGPDDAAAVAVLGRRAALEQPEQRAQSDVRREGPRLDHVGGAAARQPGVLQGGLDATRRRSCSRSSGRAVNSPCTTRRREKLTHISTCFSTHHLMFAEDANRTLWTSGGGQVVGWLNTKMFDETRRRGEVAGLDGARHRHQRQRQARRVRRARTSRSIPTKDKRFGGAFYAVVARAGRIDLGLGAGISRRGRPPDARIESAGHGAG